MSVYYVHSCYLQRPEEHIGSPGTGVYRWLNVAVWALGVGPQSFGSFVIAVNLGTIHCFSPLLPF